MTNAVGTEVVRGRIGRYMQTASGRRFWPLDPEPEDVCIGDIAHALAAINRFGGHAREPYSVAQHSVHVATIVEPVRSDLALHALLHDATEAYLGDIVRPLKLHLLVAADSAPAAPPLLFAEVESSVQIAIAIAFGLRSLAFDEFDIIKQADNIALATEARDLMGAPCWPEMPEPDAARIVPLTFDAARRQFLATFDRLKGSRQP